jgi:hypothetical protein
VAEYPGHIALPAVPALDFKERKPGDLILIFFYALAGQALKYDPATIHTFFADLRKDNAARRAFPELNELFFNEYGLYPYSRQIESVLSHLQQAGILCKFNPYYDKMQVDADMEEVYKLAYSQMNPVQKRLLKKMTAALGEKLIVA